MSDEEQIERAVEVLAFVRKGHRCTSTAGYFAGEHVVTCACGESWSAPGYSAGDRGMVEHIERQQAIGLVAAAFVDPQEAKPK